MKQTIFSVRSKKPPQIQATSIHPHWVTDSFGLFPTWCYSTSATTKRKIKIYIFDRIMEEYGVTPRQMIEVKALMGDTSDNIRVKGESEKDCPFPYQAGGRCQDPL